jgi:Domain of unknown function (DUF4157)
MRQAISVQKPAAGPSRARQGHSASATQEARPPEAALAPLQGHPDRLPEALARVSHPGMGALRGQLLRNLQRTYGNQAVVRLVQGPGKTVLQRKCAPCASGQGSCPKCAEEDGQTLHRQAANQSPAFAVPSVVHDVLRSPGRSLDPSTRAFFEPRFGHDFSQVRVHTDTYAAESARAVDALAYTVGRDIVFGAGRYQPQTSEGRRLLAHELTHTIQQSSGRGAALGMSMRMSEPGDWSEHEAHRTADVVLSHNAAVPSGFTSSPSLIQRVCGEAAIGTPGGCDPGDPVFLSGFPLFKFKVNCDDFEPGQDTALVKFAGALAPTVTLEIHGFASVDGPAMFNQNLACARALKARAVLTAAPPHGPGIASSRISPPVNHGPTPGPATERRSVVIRTTTPAPCMPPPCPSPPPGHELRNPGIPSRALCRGACGADCDPDACRAQPAHVLCLSDPSGTCHRICTYAVLECGSHQACRDHDACYDRCAAAGEMDLCNLPCLGGTVNPCHCRCDEGCCNVHGRVTCAQWSQGHGPQPDRLRFTDPPTDSGIRRGACSP